MVDELNLHEQYFSFSLIHNQFPSFSQGTIRLLVAGGVNVPSDAEVVEVNVGDDGGVPVPCYKPADLPQENYGAVGAMVGGMPTICGGVGADGDMSQQFD